MNATVIEDRTCLEAAVEAWLRPRGDREEQMDDLHRLAAYGVFSNRQLEAITELDWRIVKRVSTKMDRTGGRLVLSTLPLMVWLQADYERGIRNKRVLRLILDAGTSQRTVSRLTGIHLRAIERMAA